MRRQRHQLMIHVNDMWSNGYQENILPNNELCSSCLIHNKQFQYLSFNNTHTLTQLI